MTAAMISSDMPTSGTVIFPVRTLASVSCSAESALRNVAHLAARLLATGAPAEAAERRRRGDLLQLDELEVVAELGKRRHERAVRRFGDEDPPAQLDEQATVAGLRSLTQRPFVADVAGEQHRDDIEV